MGVQDIYRDRASMGHLPVLRGQTLMEEPYRLQLDANTIGLWWFDEKTNGMTANGLTTSLLDKATTPHLGTLVNTPTWGTTGPWGSDLGFVMTSTQYVTIASGCNVGSGDLTVEVVFKAAALPETATYDSTWHHLIVGRVPLVGGVKWWALTLYGHAAGASIGKLNWYVLDTADVAIVSSSRVDDGLYHYIAGTLSHSAQTGALYLDGIDVGSGAMAIGTGGALDSGTLTFGRNTAAANALTGSIATVRISTVVRSAAEILTNAKLMGFA
jgi:hypothetical protein